MLKRLLSLLAILVVLAIGSGLWLTRAVPADPAHYTGLSPDPGRGEQVFWAAGCASCHAAEGARGAAKLELVGGQKFPSEFGTFVAPNISPDPDHGIGEWTTEDFASAVTRGVSPGGSHYYPVFPYTAYILMTPQDVVDLKAYMDTLPASAQDNPPNEVVFPFNIRRGVGVWKRLYLKDAWVIPGDLEPETELGRYNVEALAHCCECHTPRTALGGLERNRWLAGAPNPTGRGNIPDLTLNALSWSDTDIAYYLETGFTPDFDSAGGHMASVVDNMSHLTPDDRRAIAEYLKIIPPDPVADGS